MPWFLCGALLGFIGLLVGIGVTPVERKPEEEWLPRNVSRARHVREEEDDPVWNLFSLIVFVVFLAGGLFIWLGL